MSDMDLNVNIGSESTSNFGTSEGSLSPNTIQQLLKDIDDDYDFTDQRRRNTMPALMEIEDVAAMKMGTSTLPNAMTTGCNDDCRPSCPLGLETFLCEGKPLNPNRKASQRMSGDPAPIVLSCSIADFFRDHHCYELIPTSSKLIALDVNLNVKKAFFALIYNGVRAGMLWDNTLSRYIGLLTITDFIKVLCHYTTGGDRLDPAVLEKNRISDWLSTIPARSNKMITVSDHQSVYDAITILRDNRIHRLPVVDPKTRNVLCILTHKRILKFFYLFLRTMTKPPCLSMKLSKMKIGTYGNVHTVTLDTPLSDVFVKFLKTKVSAFPIVDEMNCLVGVYSKFDVLHVAAEGTYTDLDATLRSVLKAKKAKHGVVKPLTTHMDAHLNDVVEKFVKFQVHRLIVVDSDQKVHGIISLSDLLGLLIEEHHTASQCSPPRKLPSVVET